MIYYKKQKVVYSQNELGTNEYGWCNAREIEVDVPIWVPDDDVNYCFTTNLISREEEGWNGWIL